MNFTNPTHLDYIIFTNVTNLVYPKTDKLKFTSAKVHNIFHIHKNINNFITPQHKNNQKTIINSNQPAPYPTATFKQPSPKKTATITLPTYKVRKVDTK